MAKNDDIKITLLSERQISGPKNNGWNFLVETKLDVIDKFGILAAITDLALLTGGDYERSSFRTAPDEKANLRERHCWYYTRSSNHGGDVSISRIYDSVDSSDQLYCYKRSGAIRPVLLLPNELFKEVTQNRTKGYRGTEEVEYGEYPQYAASLYNQKLLESLYRSGKLRATGRDYTFDKTKFDDYDQPFQPVKYEEYEYNYKKYIRVKANSCRSRCFLSGDNGELYDNGSYIWVEVSPVVWLIDDKAKILVSKRCLLSGIRFNNDKKKYSGNFSKTEMYEYLNKHMIHDLFQCFNKTKEDITLENQNEIINLLKEIQKYTKYYNGDIDIKEKVESLIQDYNLKLEDIANTSNSNDVELLVEVNSIDTLRQKLVSDLEGILFELKNYSVNVKSYYDMKEILEECQKVTDIDPKKDELCEMISKVRSILSSSIINRKIKNDLNSELDKIIEENIKRNDESLIKFKSLSIKPAEAESLEKLKLNFRRDIHPYLIKLNDTILKLDVIDEAIGNVLLILNDDYKDTKNNQVKYFSNVVQEIVEKVRQIGSKEDEYKLKCLLDFEIDSSKDITEILKDLNEVVINAYKLEFDILERNKNVKNVNSNMVRVNIDKIFDDQEKGKVLSKKL